MRCDELLIAYLLKHNDSKDMKELLLANNVVKVFDSQDFLLNDDIKNIIKYNRYLRKLDLCIVEEISNIFSKNNIRHLFLKGLPLSQYLYDDPFSRMSADVDLYVYNEDFYKAYELLKNSGFLLVNKKYIKSEHHISLAKKNLLLELHKNILNPIIGINEGFLLNRQGYININNKKIATFDKTATIIHLIYHLYMDSWMKSSNYYSLFATKSIAKANRFLYRAYEIALFSEKYSTEIDWEEIAKDMKNQKFTIIFKKMINDVLEIFPETFPKEIIDLINSLNYAGDEKDALYKYIIEKKPSIQSLNRVLSGFIDKQWNNRADKNILIYNKGQFILDNIIVEDVETDDNYRFVCIVKVEKIFNDVKLVFRITNNDFCFSDNGDYNTQNSDGVHLIICGTKKYSYNSIFLFPKIIDGNPMVVPVNVLNRANCEIDENLIQTAYNATEKEYTITVVLKEEFILENNLENYFYLGIVVSDCSSKTQKRKTELILSNSYNEWYNPIYFAKIEL